MLAEAERRDSGGPCVRYGLEILIRWFGKLNMRVQEPPGQLQLTQVGDGWEG